MLLCRCPVFRDPNNIGSLRRGPIGGDLTAGRPTTARGSPTAGPPTGEPPTAGPLTARGPPAAPVDFLPRVRSWVPFRLDQSRILQLKHCMKALDVLYRIILVRNVRFSFSH